jgi:CPA1 family monovalent cation:H+ antiporter
VRNARLGGSRSPPDTAPAVTGLARFPRLPGTVALVVAGLIVGGVARVVGARPVEVPPELVLLILLPGLVFEAAYRLDLTILRRWVTGLALLAVPGVVVSAAVTALAVSLATGLRLDLAFIAGAIVSATDPAAVVATFKRIRVPTPLATLVDGESLLNDGTGLVLFTIAIAAVTSLVAPASSIIAFFGTILLSLGIGLAAGALAASLARLVRHAWIELAISLLLAFGSYEVAAQLGLSGVLATVTAAVILGNFGRHVLTPDGQDVIDAVWTVVAAVLTGVVFLLVGLAIPLIRLLDSGGPIVWAIVGATVARALIVYVLLGGLSRVAPIPGLAHALPLGWLHVLFWSGLRGAVAIAMALALPVDVPQRGLLQEIAFGVVLFTLLVQATTVGWVVDRAVTRSAPAE